MAVNSDQLADDYNNIKDRFSHSPYVKILSTEGDPPNSYQIEYRIKGLTKNEAGQVVEADSHRVEITLPFGYPYFPPNCKPLTSIFHPDIDPDAVRIGDFWDGSHSLVDLVVHIGNLIAFQKYSTENVFNSEALEWTTANSDKIPLAKIDFTVQEAASDTSEATEQISLSLESEEVPEIPQIQEEKPEAKPEAPPATGPIKKEKSSNLFKIIGGGIFLVIAVISLLLVLDVRNHNKALQHWENIQTLVDQNEFTEANRLVLESQSNLESIKFLKKNEKEELLQKINALVASERFQQGLQGKILANGAYLTAQELQTSKDLSDLLAKGEKMAEASKWQNASDTFELAVNKAKELGKNSPMPLADIEELLTRSRILLQMDTGKKLSSQGKWKQAITIYEAALGKLSDIKTAQKSKSTGFLSKTEKFLERARSGSGALGITQDDIRQKMLSLSNELQKLLAQGEMLFQDGKWQEAADTYEKAVQKAMELDELSPISASNVKNLLTSTIINQQLQQGNTLSDQGKWQEAIKSYEVALEKLSGMSSTQNNSINLLSKSEEFLAESRANSGVLGITPTEINRKILSASIDREEYRVANYLKQEEYGRAVQSLQKIVSLINQSPFKKEKKYTAIKQSALTKIQENKFLHEIQEKASYLNTNYQQIFREKFASSTTSELSEPEIEFYKSIGNLLIFKMQCQEKIRRQKYTLEMYYQYDTASQTWSVYR